MASFAGIVAEKRRKRWGCHTFCRAARMVIIREWKGCGKDWAARNLSPPDKEARDIDVLNSKYRGYMSRLIIPNQHKVAGSSLFCVCSTT